MERGGHAPAQGALSGRDAPPHPRRQLRHAARALAQAVRRHSHRQPVRRHAVGRGLDVDRLARHVAFGLLGAADAAVAAALYEPVHGSAPDIAGKGVANPIATIASFAMALRYSFDQAATADLIERAIAFVLDEGYRTADIAQDGCRTIGTAEMGKAMISALDRMAK